MKTIILYYSHSGNTKALANKKAKELGSDIEEIIESKRPFPFMIIGIHRASKRKKTEIQLIKAQMNNYDKFIIMAPVWAAHPAPAFNNVIEYLPTGKDVELIMVSGGGGTKKSTEGTKNLIIQKGCTVVNYTDVRVKRKGDEVFCQILK